jgi:hypothetical protein
VRRHAPELVLTAVALLLGGCGGGASGDDSGRSPARTSTAPAPPPAGSPQARVIRAWSDTLRQGDIRGAARYFALPSVVSNGTPPLAVRTRDQAATFNRALPCGSRLLRTLPRGRYLVAVFRLTDRTGPGAQRPCSGRGAEAAVAFRIAAGHIREWRRVAAVPRRGAPIPAAPGAPTQST